MYISYANLLLITYKICCFFFIIFNDKTYKNDNNQISALERYLFKDLHARLLIAMLINVTIKHDIHFRWF